jgi:hypothetical protein
MREWGVSMVADAFYQIAAVPTQQHSAIPEVKVFLFDGDDDSYDNG